MYPGNKLSLRNRKVPGPYIQTAKKIIYVSPKIFGPISSVKVEFTTISVVKATTFHTFVYWERGHFYLKTTISNCSVWFFFFFVKGRSEKADRNAGLTYFISPEIFKAKTIEAMYRT